jgi:DNA-binding XRE family transcriptional regulator
MTPEKIKVARQLYKAKELTVEEIAKTIGVSKKTVLLAETGISSSVS